MPSLDNLASLLRASLDDVARVTALLNTTMQQVAYPAFELSRDGVVWYLNGAAAEAIGVSPQQAVGTRLTTYVGDGLMTQRRLDALGQSSQAQSWPDAWRRKRRTFPCRMTAFVIPSALSVERPRVILWSEPPDVRERQRGAAHADQPDTLLPGDRHVLGQDLDPLCKRHRVKITRLCEQIGVSPITWYAWRRAAVDPITSRTIELHVRLLDAMPDLLHAGVHPLDLQEALRSQRGIDLPLTDVALLLGVDPRNAYGWRQGQPTGAQIQALTASLLRLLMHKPRASWDDYLKLVDRQAELEGVDLWKIKSWTPEATPAVGGDSPAAAPPKRGGRRGRFKAVARGLSGSDKRNRRLPAESDSGHVQKQDYEHDRNLDE